MSRTVGDVARRDARRDGRWTLTVDLLVSGLVGGAVMGILYLTYGRLVAAGCADAVNAVCAIRVRDTVTPAQLAHVVQIRFLVSLTAGFVSSAVAYFLRLRTHPGVAELGIRPALSGVAVLAVGAVFLAVLARPGEPPKPTVNVVRAGPVYALVQARHSPLKWPDCGPVDYPCQYIGGVGYGGHLTLLNGRCLGLDDVVVVWGPGTQIRGSGQGLTVRFAGLAYRMGDQIKAGTDTLEHVTVGEVSQTISGGAPGPCRDLPVVNFQND